MRPARHDRVPEADPSQARTVSNGTPIELKICTQVLLNPHLGSCFVPFMKSTTCAREKQRASVRACRWEVSVRRCGCVLRRNCRCQRGSAAAAPAGGLAPPRILWRVILESRFLPHAQQRNAMV